jgi:hypothetical protein
MQQEMVDVVPASDHIPQCGRHVCYHRLGTRNRRSSKDPPQRSQMKHLREEVSGMFVGEIGLGSTHVPCTGAGNSGLMVADAANKPARSMDNTKKNVFSWVGLQCSAICDTHASWRQTTGEPQDCVRMFFCSHHITAVAAPISSMISRLFFLLGVGVVIAAARSPTPIEETCDSGYPAHDVFNISPEFCMDAPCPLDASCGPQTTYSLGACLCCFCPVSATFFLPFFFITSITCVTVNPSTHMPDMTFSHEARDTCAMYMKTDAPSPTCTQRYTHTDTKGTSRGIRMFRHRNTTTRTHG